ncbi:MAG TPA: hypothetical protein VI935_05785 [Thermodesulfobacteriota bacterium]|nr:hypothetical protein [Thermodesulfobacteriota bacterium]
MRIKLKYILEDLIEEVDSIDWSDFEETIELERFYKKPRRYRILDEENKVLTRLVISGLKFLATQ